MKTKARPGSVFFFFFYLLWHAFFFRFFFSTVLSRQQQSRERRERERYSGFRRRLWEEGGIGEASVSLLLPPGEAPSLCHHRTHFSRPLFLFSTSSGLHFQLFCFVLQFLVEKRIQIHVSGAADSQSGRTEHKRGPKGAGERELLTTLSLPFHTSSSSLHQTSQPRSLAARAAPKLLVTSRMPCFFVFFSFHGGKKEKGRENR